MPISPIILQRRHAELGRIRLGDKGSKGQPQRLSQFRFTSPHQRHIADLAQLYGGEARPWKNGNRDEWEVYSDTQSIPVIVVKGGVSQWLEAWSGGGCVHRCDGVTNVLTDEPCDPDEFITVGRDNKKLYVHRDAKPTTRLSVMLRDLDAIGVWRLESHGWNAAAELPGLVELAQHVADLVPARLMLSERVSIRDGKTSRFVVPGLDLEVAPGRLAEIMGGNAQQPAAVEGRSPAAIEASARIDVDAEVEGCTTREDLNALWQRIKDAGPDRVDKSWAYFETAMKGRAAALGLTDKPAAAAPAKDVVEGTVEDPPTSDLDEDGAWLACVSEGGKLGWTTEQLKEAYTGWTGGDSVDDADAKRLNEFRAHVAKQAEQVPA